MSAPGWAQILLDTTLANGVETVEKSELVTKATDNIAESLTRSIKAIGGLLWKAADNSGSPPERHEVFEAGCAIEELTELLERVLLINSNAHFARLNLERGLAADNLPIKLQAAA